MIVEIQNDTLRVSAPAKINLFLELLGKRADGYHELETIMTTVSLFDTMIFRATSHPKIALSVDFEPANQPAAASVPTDDRNLVVRSLLRLRERYASAPSSAAGMQVQLTKRIPSAAGLGGASSDAAAAIVAGNVLWGLGLNQSQLREVAAEIGSDVPFFLDGGVAMCRGRGERIEPAECNLEIHFVVAQPAVGLATPTVFANCSIPTEARCSRAMTDALSHGTVEAVAQHLTNRLQPAAMAITDEIGKLKAAFDQINCLGHQMSGSGSSYFGVFSSQMAAEQSARQLSHLVDRQVKLFCLRNLPRFDWSIPELVRIHRG